MNSDANVVHLNTSAVNKTGGSSVSTKKIRDHAVIQLRQSLQMLFDNADDTLFKMADRSISNTEQGVFFEAMRDLRLKRKGIERAFQQSLFDAFANLSSCRLPSAPSLENMPLDSLALVQNDELEESVALGSMIAKVMSSERVALNHLSMRINAIAGNKVDVKCNPLGPVFLCESFVKACSGLDVGIKVKLIVFKLFEKYVLSGLGQLYQEINGIFLDAGVLPGLAAQERRGSTAFAAQGNARGPSVSAQQIAAGPGVGEVFAVLQQLLAEAGQHAGSQLGSLAKGLAISSDDLMHLLSYVQRRASSRSGAEPSLGLHEQLEQLLASISAKSGRTRTLGQVDEDVVNLVSMLFEFILDDRSLPDSLKALIARLQIPILKVALLDKSFFSKGSHPARRLLNEIASASLGWNEQDADQRDTLYQRVDQLVQRLLNDFTDDPGIFSELLNDFLGFSQSEQRRSALLESRMRDAEEGGARIERARLDVEQALNQRLLGRVFPEILVVFLREVWSKVMLLTCLRRGTDSDDWQTCLATMDSLIWAMQSCDKAEDRQSLLKLLPTLIENLQGGMSEAALQSFSSHELFDRLDAIQSGASLLPSEVCKVADNSVTGAADSQLEMPVETTDEQPESRVSQEQSVLPLVEVIEEIVLQSPEQGPVAEQEQSIVVQDEVLGLVDALRVGSWLEFTREDGGKLRCKLAAIIKPNSKHVFVNRVGMKVLEKTRMGLAVEFRRKSVRILDDALLFDRALESVIANLQRLKGN